MPRHSVCPIVPGAKYAGQPDASLLFCCLWRSSAGLGLKQAMLTRHSVCLNACPAGLMSHEVRHENSKT